MIYRISVFVGTAEDQSRIKQYAKIGGISCVEKEDGELSLEVKTTVDLLMPVLIDVNVR